MSLQQIPHHRKKSINDKLQKLPLKNPSSKVHLTIRKKNFNLHQQ